MAKNLGQIYESASFKYLKGMGLAVGDGPAGSLSNIPDIWMKLAKGKAADATGLELKTNPTAAGGLVMQYDWEKSKWKLGKTKGDEEKELLVKLAKKYKIVEMANDKKSPWGKNIPFLQYKGDTKRYVGNITPANAYKKDIKQYGGKSEIHVDINNRSVQSYYNTKECFYMNVGSHGFYLLGNSDPLDLNGKLKSLRAEPIPIFNFPIFIRCRCQDKGGGSYNFNMVQTMKSGPHSPYNLLPMNSSGSINMREVQSKANQILLKAFRT